MGGAKMSERFVVEQHVAEPEGFLQVQERRMPLGPSEERALQVHVRG